MSCEQEVNSDSTTCVFVPVFLPFSSEIRECPSGFTKYDNQSVIPSSPICIQNDIPPGYVCAHPLRCVKPRGEIMETYKRLRRAYG